jgi:DnaJ-class molecular chaperone
MSKIKKCNFCNGTGKTFEPPLCISDSGRQVVCKKCNGKGMK